MYNFYNSLDDDEPYNDSSPTPPVESTVEAPQWPSMIPLQRVQTVEKLSQDPSCDARDKALRQELLSTCMRRDELSKRYSEHYHSITRLESELEAEKEAAASAEANFSSKGTKARSGWAIKEFLGLGRNKSSKESERSDPSKESIIKKLKYEQAEIESQQKIVFASFDRINAESKHLADTLWNEKVGQYSQNISDGLTEVRYNSFKSDEVQAIPDIRKAISVSQSVDSADSQWSRREIRSMLQEMISQNQAADTCDESMIIRSERVIHSTELGNYGLDILYPDISPVQRWVFDTPLKDESVVQRLAEKGYDSRGWPTGAEELGERAGGVHQPGTSRRMIGTSVRFESA